MSREEHRETPWTAAGASAGVRGRVLTLLSGVRPSDENAERWLVQLRWVAVVGMSATIGVAGALLPGLSARALWVLMGLITLSNLGWSWALGRGERSASRVDLDAREGEGEEAVEPRRMLFVHAQIATDVVSLGAVLWFAGGLENPFAAFLAFQIAIAGLLCTPRGTLGIGVLTVSVVALLLSAPPLPLSDNAPRSGALLRLGQGVSIASVSAFLAIFVAVYAERLGALRRDSARNEKLALLGRLVGGLSHELATPLATVALAAQELGEVLQAAEDPEVRRLVGALSTEARRASEIIGVMQGHVRPDLQRERFELCAYAEGVARTELERLGFRGAFVFQGREKVEVYLLQPALRQILVNLLANAAEACARSPRGPRIGLSVERTGERVDLTVSDSGPGFGEAILPRLGEPFQSTKVDQGGMGLGLYVCLMLARRLRAMLQAHNDPDGGARVTLRLLREGRREVSRLQE